MKQLIKASHKTFVLLLIAVFYQVTALAQADSATSNSSATTTTTTSHPAVQPADWYTQPWVWIVGVIILILIIIALTRTNSSTGRIDKVTTTTTVRRDSETT